MLRSMAKRLLLLIGVLSVPVGVALGSQALSQSVEPPNLPDQQIDTQEEGQ